VVSHHRTTWNLKICLDPFLADQTIPFTLERQCGDEMYRTAAKRVLLLRAPSGINNNARLRFPPLRFSTSVNPNQLPETPNFSDPASSSSTSSSTSTSSSSSNWSASSTAEEARRQENQRPRVVEYEDEQARVLRASLPHVVRSLIQ
jgi:ubiquinone biosynthesis protein COQ9